MRMEPDDIQRRKAQRKAYRQAKKRRFLIKIIVAVLALALCGGLIGALVAISRSRAASKAPENQTVIHLAAVGDINITEKVVRAGTGSYDYTELFLDVIPALSAADLTVGNFEGTLCGPPYGTDFSAPIQFAESLAKAGLDGVQMANSHSIRGGISGLRQTLTGLRTAGLIPFGAFENRKDFQETKGYTILDVQGVRIVFVAFTKGMDGMALPAGSEDCVNLLYTDYSSTYQTIDYNGISRILEAAQKENPDLLVAMLHWGSEHNDTISASQEKICKAMKDGGVDVILGTHSHFLQKMEYDEATGSFTAWSLGDFLGDGTRAGSNYSVILNLEITKDGDAGTTRVTGFDYTPVYIMNEKNKPLRLLRIRESVEAYESGQLERVSKQTYEDMLYALERIEKRIAGE